MPRTPITYAELRQQRKALIALVKDSHRIINRGVKIMSDRQVSKWQGVRGYLEYSDQKLEEFKDGSQPDHLG